MLRDARSTTTVRAVALVAGAAVLAMTVLTSCADGSAAPATTTTTRPTSTTTTVASTSTTTTSVPTSTSSTTTTSTTSSTTTTTSSTTTTTEPARRRPPDTLRRPDGYARHEPLPAWEGEAALTGLEIDPTIAARPALAVKIDNAPGGRPPWNLADADLVVEENVEGITRFVAVYHSTTPDRIGPVRSARLSDLDILASLNRPVLAWSGGNPGVTSYVRAGHRLGWFSNLSAQSTSCFWRSVVRRAPHNLVLDPTCVWESTTYAGPARPVFARDDGTPPSGAGEREFRVRMDGITISWVWDPGTDRYLRRQAGDWHVDADGDAVAATNVVVLEVDYEPSVVDARSPQAITVGSGRATVHRGGMAIPGTWTRADRFDPFTLVTSDGRPLTLAPGTTFVELTR